MHVWVQTSHHIQVSSFYLNYKHSSITTNRSIFTQLYQINVINKNYTKINFASLGKNTPFINTALDLIAKINRNLNNQTSRIKIIIINKHYYIHL